MIGIGIPPFISNKPMSTAKEIKYLFIDGACLDDILKRISAEIFDNDVIELMYERLSSSYDKVFYYDALPRQNKGESKEVFGKRLTKKENFLNHLKLLDKFHVYEGVVFERKEKLTQKAVDIMIAVDMLRHSFRKNMSKATLLTGDLDFKPLIDALIQEGMYTTVLIDPRITSKELLYAADSNQILHLSWIYSCTTDNFKKTHPAPQICQGEYIDLIKMSGQPIKKGSLNNNSILLYHIIEKNSYLLLYSPINKNERFATFSDDEMLIKWFEYEYNGKIVWGKDN
jgi:uncharacterized LabA/DUF88 family protein